MKTLIVTIVVYVSITHACKCKTQTTEESFCAADWVSHVRVKLRVSKQPMPPGSARKGLNNLRYAVNHVRVYKRPNGVGNLPAEIYTPSEPPACGLIIEAGKEYLLAGKIHNGTLHTVLCGQVLGDNPTEELYENVLEWSKVPKQLQEKLPTINCEKKE
ncbi:tissue inhibitor of metalloproteinase [Ancylostoma caninum]|uniref:Tissue inhibitor of metalloproteinase n=1 Tax=Ancylostoma caninum TaxID=29170 RepID=A0A368FKL5_ANCCA|nr:tissue inhibitor of metalloproteinase [Ancylostoma caninum]